MYLRGYRRTRRLIHSGSVTTLHPRAWQTVRPISLPRMSSGRSFIAGKGLNLQCLYSTTAIGA